MMSNSEKLQNLKRWNKIETFLRTTNDNLKVLEVQYDGILIDESRPYEIDDLDDEELYEYLVNMFNFKNIPVLITEDYEDLKSSIVGNKVVGLMCITLFIIIVVCQSIINDFNVQIAFIPLTIILSAIFYYNIKEIYKKSKKLKNWDDGELFSRNIICYKKRARINHIRK